jgi:hypothetical protein
MDTTERPTTSPEPIYQRLVYEMDAATESTLPAARSPEADAG